MDEAACGKSWFPKGPEATEYWDPELGEWKLLSPGSESGHVCYEDVGHGDYHVCWCGEMAHETTFHKRVAFRTAA